MRSTAWLALPLLLGVFAACSSSGSSSSASPAGTPPVAAGPTSDPLLAPPPEGKGAQFKMVTTLEPGQEIERVQFFQVPAGGLYVNREEIRFSAGSHHVLLFRTPYTSIPTVDTHGKTHDTSQILDAPNGGTADWNVDGVVGGAQSANGAPLIDGLPPNVAFKIDAGTVLMMNTHYLNAAAKPVTVSSYINMWTIPKEQVTEEAGILFFYDPIIRVAPRASGYAEMSCPVGADVKILNLQTHMHRRGMGGQAFLSAPGSEARELIYESDHWEDVLVKKFEPPLAMKAGSWVNYHCNYKNDEDRTVLQGASTKDEMCMIIGLYYPRDAKTETCSVDGSYKNLSTAGTWAGKGGTATCIESLDCLQGARTEDAGFQCILNACPKVAKPFNDFFKCRGSENAKCQPTCASDADPSACTNRCVEQACAPLLKACTYATCN